MAKKITMKKIVRLGTKVGLSGGAFDGKILIVKPNLDFSEDEVRWLADATKDDYFYLYDERNGHREEMMKLKEEIYGILKDVVDNWPEDDTLDYKAHGSAICFLDWIWDTVESNDMGTAKKRHLTIVENDVDDKDNDNSVVNVDFATIQAQREASKKRHPAGKGFDETPLAFPGAKEQQEEETKESDSDSRAGGFYKATDETGDDADSREDEGIEIAFPRVVSREKVDVEGSVEDKGVEIAFPTSSTSRATEDSEASDDDEGVDDDFFSNIWNKNRQRDIVLMNKRLCKDCKREVQDETDQNEMNQDETIWVRRVADETTGQGGGWSQRDARFNAYLDDIRKKIEVQRHEKEQRLAALEKDRVNSEERAKELIAGILRKFGLTDDIVRHEEDNGVLTVEVEVEGGPTFVFQDGEWRQVPNERDRAQMWWGWA